MKMGLAAIGLTLITAGATAQPPSSAPAPPSAQTTMAQNSQAPIVITFADALQRARKLDTTYRTALTDAGIAHEDHVQARAALLPNVSANTEYLYTQGNGTSTPRYIANNAVHEYAAQG